MTKWGIPNMRKPATRVYDLLISPDFVFWDGSLVSDRYVIVNVSAIPGVAHDQGLTEPGAYRLYKGKPAVRLNHPASVPNLCDVIPGDEHDWKPVSWSRFSDGDARIGGFGGSPVLVDGAWVSRLPSSVRCEAYSSTGPVRLLGPNLVAGIVMPIRRDLGDAHAVIAADAGGAYG